MEPNSPSIPSQTEPPALRRAFLALALAVAALFLAGTHHYWVPADPNVDENTYLFSGKLLAQTGSPGFVPPDPYSLVGTMWISTPEGRFYPKYPLGQTLLVAAAIKTFGLRAAYLVNPLLMTLALFGAFLLVREAAGSLAGFLGMLAMATSPALLAETNDPDSHAGAVFFTIWGMFLVLRWWRTGKPRHAALAGLLLGFSAITRYTEGLLLLPMALVVLFQLRRREERRRSLAGAAALAAGWLLPVACQLAFNLRTLHRLNGYAATHESTAFSLEYLARHWGLVLRQFFTLGLPLLFPLTVVGLALLTLRDRRLGVVLWAWTLPNLLLYTAYYWTAGDITYTRFFLSIYPPLVLGMAWLLTRPLRGLEGPRRWAQPAVALAVVLACGAFGVRESLPVLKGIQQDQRQAWEAGVAALAAAPPGSVFFGPQQALFHLQYVGDDYLLYSRALFVPQTLARLDNVDPRAPNPLQPERARALYKLLKRRKPVGMLRLERNLAAAALSRGRRVFLIAPPEEPVWSQFASPDLDPGDQRSFHLQPLAHWIGWQRAEPGGQKKTLGWELLEVTASSRPSGST